MGKFKNISKEIVEKNNEITGYNTMWCFWHPNRNYILKIIKAS